MDEVEKARAYRDLVAKYDRILKENEPRESAWAYYGRKAVYFLVVTFFLWAGIDDHQYPAAASMFTWVLVWLPDLWKAWKPRS